MSVRFEFRGPPKRLLACFPSSWLAAVLSIGRDPDADGTRLNTEAELVEVLQKGEGTNIVSMCPRRKVSTKQHQDLMPVIRRTRELETET